MSSSIEKANPVFYVIYDFNTIAKSKSKSEHFLIVGVNAWINEIFSLVPNHRRLPSIACNFCERKASKFLNSPTILFSLWNLGRVELLFEKYRRSDVQNRRAECTSKPFVTTSTIHVIWQLQFKMIPKWITEVDRKGIQRFFLCATEAKTV